MYESVTTALGNQPGKKEGLMEWRRRIGEAEANRISRKAAGRGTAVHQIIEDYLNNLDDPIKDKMPDAVVMFKQLQPILDKSISKVYMQEAPLWSYKYRLAGRVDCVADIKGKLTVVDFKTSMRPKKREWVADYFLQTAAYSHMIGEMYGETVDQTVIFIAVEDRDPQIFVGDPHTDITHEFFEQRIA
jgi:genome maintenance exonuclease 1